MRNNRDQRKESRARFAALLWGTATLGAVVTSTIFYGSDFVNQAMMCQPATAADAPSTSTTPDYFCGKFENIGGFFPHAKDPRHVEIVKEGNEYRLVGTKSYDAYKFVKIEDGILQDKEKHLGKIHMGTASFKGIDMKMRILKVDLCYNSFLLLPLNGQTRWILPPKK